MALSDISSSVHRNTTETPVVFLYCGIMLYSYGTATTSMFLYNKQSLFSVCVCYTALTNNYFEYSFVANVQIHLFLPIKQFPFVL